MGHHANDMPFQDEEGFKKLMENLNMGSMGNPKINPLDLGATGKYPEGKIADNDEGEIKIGITTMKGRVVIDFGKQIYTVGFTPDQAMSIAEVLIKRAMEIKTKG